MVGMVASQPCLLALFKPSKGVADANDMAVIPRAYAEHMSHAASFDPVLADDDVAILDFEENWFTSAVPKEQAIMERFGTSATRYYQRLNTLIDMPAALDHKPLLVKRLRRLRSQRQAARSAERLRR